ncbi:MAG: hypothetical protein NVS3B7_03640 [Candidatus Elarobacter sp.]
MQDFEQFAEELPHIAWTLAPDGAIHYVNRRWREYTGLTAEETAAPDAWSRITPAEDIARVGPLWQHALSTTTPFVTEHRLKPATADASEFRWNLIHVVPVREAAGSLRGWIGTATDIHDRRAAEEALRESEEFLRRIIDSSDDCIKLLDLDGRLLFLSSNGAQQLGIDDLASVIGTDWTEFWPDDGTRAQARAAVEAARNGRTERFEGFLPKTDDGTPKWWNVVVSTISGANGQPERLLVSSRDITRRRRDAEALQRSEAAHRALANAVPTTVWSAGADGAIDYVNARWTDYTGLSLEDSLGYTWGALVHPEDVEDTVAAWQRSVAERRAHHHTFRLRRASDGAYRWHVAHAIPMLGPDGEIVRWYGTTTDVDAEKRAEQRQRFLLAGSSILSSSLDPETTLENVARIAVQTIARFCYVDLTDDDGRLQRVAFAHSDAIAPGDLAAANSFVPALQSAESPIARAIVEQTPILVRSCDDDWIDRVTSSTEHAQHVRETGLRSLISVPLRSSSGTIGALTLCLTERDARQFDEDDLAFAGELGRQAAVAVSNAKLYEHERNVASRLQSASLPQALPSGKEIAFDAVYTPGSNEAVIGGDWYDAFELGDGRIAVSIGDVMGSGLEAAVKMGKIRQGIRAAAALDAEPSAMLAAADFAFRLDEPDGIATAFVAVIDPRAMTLHSASAGHHAPLIRRGDGTISEPAVDYGLPLGMRAGHTSATSALALESGMLVVLYTDGLIESTRDAQEGERRLRAALALPGLSQDAHPARALHDAVLVDGAADDVAILTIRVGPPESRPSER